MHSANRLADTFQALVDCYRSAEDEQDRHTMDVIASRMSQAADLLQHCPQEQVHYMAQSRDGDGWADEDGPLTHQQAQAYWEDLEAEDMTEQFRIVRVYQEVVWP